MGLYVDMEAKNDNEPYCLPVLNLVIFKFANEKARSFFFFLRVYNYFRHYK